MRKPSGRMLLNRIDIYRATTTRAGTGYDPTYAATPDVIGAPCSVQSTGRQAGDDGTGRLTQVNFFNVHLAASYAVRLRDKLVWIDPYGTTHAMYVENDYDNAGVGSMVTIEAVEKI